MLFEKRAIIDSSITEVFNLVADIAKAPNIHPMIIDRTRLDNTAELGLGSQFRYAYSSFGKIRHFDFTITEFIPNEKIVYTGTSFFGIIPQFTVYFREVGTGTEIHYAMNPTIPPLLPFFAKPIMIQVGNQDLEAYFGKLRLLLE